MRVLMILTAAAVIVAASRAATAEELEPVLTSDLLRIRTVTSIDVARDGSRAVLAVRSIAEDSDDANEKNTEPGHEYRSHIFLLDLHGDGAQPRQMTHGSRNDRSPVFSPDAGRIAFVRRGESGGKSQVWLMPVDGGEARQVTHLEHGAGDPKFSPDGRRLLVASSLPMKDIDGVPPWPMERPQRTWEDADRSPSRAASEGENESDAEANPDGSLQEIRAWLAKNAADNDPMVITRLDIHDEQRLEREMRFRHLFIVDLGSGFHGSERGPHSRCSANGDPSRGADAQRITDGFFDHRDAAFMPDGRSIVYAASKDTDRHPDRVQTAGLWMIDIDGSNDRPLLELEDWRLSRPLPSTDGSVVAFTGRKQDEPAFRPWQLGVAGVSPGDGAGDEVVWLTDEETFDASVRLVRWEHETASLLFTAAVRGGFPLMQISPGLLRPSAVIDKQHGMPVGVHRFAAGGGVVVYTQTTPANPCMLRIRGPRGPRGPRGGGGDRLAWDLNPWTAHKAISMPTEGWLTRPDGKRIHYWTMEPAERISGRRYPLLLQIHGGPSAMWGPGEMSMWHEFQVFAGRGYGIVYANPRGSGGYGYEFQRGNRQNWGDGPAGDVLAAVDHALLLEWTDPERLLISGGSYGGYLVAWIIAHDHRFRAAVAQRGVYHLPTFFGEGKAWRLVPRAMGGAPWDSRYRPIIERESPFTYVHRIRTPLLIKHGDEDLRTGVSQSEMMYRALKYLERPVEYVRYPGAGHDMSRSGDPRQRMDRINRMIEFFERYLEE